MYVHRNGKWDIDQNSFRSYFFQNMTALSSSSISKHGNFKNISYCFLVTSLGGAWFTWLWHKCKLLWHLSLYGDGKTENKQRKI